MDGLKSEAGLESVGVYMGGEGCGIREGRLTDSRQSIRGDRKGAAGKETGKFRDRVDGGRPFQLSRGIKGGENISPAGIGKNSQQGDLGKLPGD